MALSRRFLLQAGTATFAAPYLWLPARADAPVWATQTLPPYVEVEIASGRIRGGHSRGALAFKGIPYAGTVSGKNRFKKAPPVEPWTGVRDALLLGPPAMQGPGTTYGEHEPAYSEDCLVLNVWTPAVNDGKKRPVMVYNHGGGFVTGSGGQRIQDGARLAALYDVVVVAHNHRLGLFGYLYLGELGGAEYATSGNQGMLDIADALGWVKQNIAVFGGDPDNVFVFGESGGGYKTGALMAMPSAHGLFAKAGMQSGAMLRGISKSTATEVAQRLLAGLGIAPDELAKLADVPAEKFVAIQLDIDQGKGPLAVPTPAWRAAHPNPPEGLARFKDDRLGWGPVVDGTVLPRDPFAPDATPLSADIPLLIGNMHDEATFNERNNPAFFHMDEAQMTAMAQQYLGADAGRILAVYRAAMPGATVAELGIAIETATFMGNNTFTLADRKAVQPAPVYRYIDAFRSDVPIKGTDWTLRAGHATDIAVTFYNWEMTDLQGHGHGLEAASKAESGYFASFARDGVPSAEGQPAWPRYELAKRETMILDTACHVEADPQSAERQLWTALGWG